MKRVKFQKTKLAIALIAALAWGNSNTVNAQTFCTSPGSEQVAGVEDGFRYELWNQNGQGTACMTIDDGALFSGEWSDILNYLARRGLGYDKTEQHEDIGTFYTTYNCDYNPSSASGNSYLSIYGWTVDPLIEFYIVEDWRNWIPSMAEGATKKGDVDVNGSTYNIIQNTRVNQPSIEGTATFEQYFSIRNNTRNSGTVNISDHFKAWEELGMEMGKMFEVSFVIEGYKSSGSFNFNELDIFLSDGPVSAKDNSLSDNVLVYQKSNNGNLSVELQETVTNASIKIYDAMGKLTYSNESIDTNIIQINDLIAGVYIVNVSGDNLNYKTTFIVQ